MSKWENGDGDIYKYMLIFFSSSFYILIIVFTGLLYAYFASNPGCGLNVTYITVNLILVLVMTGASVLPKIQEANPRSGIFQAAVMSLYITYLVGSAIGTQPLDVFQCRSFSSNSDTSTDPLSRVMLYVGIAITFVALGYQAFSAGSASDTILGAPEDDKDDETEEVKYNYSWFHFVFLMAGMYMTAVLTNWAAIDASTLSQQGGSDAFLKVDYGVTSMWIKVGTSWLCALLYLWTLVAPVSECDEADNVTDAEQILLPDRDFA